MDADWTPQERQKKIVASLNVLGEPDAPLPQRCRAVSEALWATIHNNDLPHDEMLRAMALISGFACAILHDAAKTLETWKDSR